MKIFQIATLLAAAQAIKVKQDTAGGPPATDGPPPMSDEDAVLLYLDTDGSGMISLDEGMTGLSGLGLSDDVVGFIRGEIEAEAAAAGEDLDGEVPASEVVDFVEGIGFAYCISSGDPVCDEVDSLQDAAEVIPFGDLTVEDIIAVA